MASPELSSLLSHIFSVVWWVGAKKMTCASECKCEYHVCQISRAAALHIARNAYRKQTCASECNCRVATCPRGYRVGAASVLRRSASIARAPGFG